jgi:hypothetical protein
VIINLSLPGFAPIVTGVGACIEDALSQTPAGAPCRICLLVPSYQITWDGCGPCEDDNCTGQLALAIRTVYGSEIFPTPFQQKTWTKCGPRWQVARCVASVTRCVPTLGDNGVAPDCAAELAAAITLENDRTAVRQAIACCLEERFHASPAVVGQWALLDSTIVGEQGACSGTETEFLVGVAACPCPSG